MNEEYIWFNQKYLTHKDITFQTNGGSMELVAACNSKDDLQSFSPPSLNFSIFNEGRYNVNLKYQDIIDLLNSIEQVQSNIEEVYKQEKAVEINKIYNGKNLKILFRTSQNTGTKAVRFMILNNSTDYGVIAVSYNTIFITIVDILKTFKENYIKISFDISNRALSYKLLDELRSIKEFVKSIPSSIIDSNINNNKLEPTDEFEDPNIINTSLQKDFDEFYKTNVKSIEIPDIDKIAQETTNEDIINKTGSILIDDILKNDIKNLDSLFTSVNTCINPMEKVIDTIQSYYDSNFSLLPGISDDELKSVVYYSKLFFTTGIQNYMKNNIPIPISIPVIKYQALNCDSKNIDLAYDLLTISIYVRLVKEKLQNRVDDATINKSILYMSLRNFTDVLIFSFLDDVDINQITNCILNRFDIFSKSNFFNRFDELLENYNFQKISKMEIKSFLMNTLSKIIGAGKVVYISELQENDYTNGKIKLHPKNNISIDKIVNEVVRAEVNTKLNISDVSLKLSDDILELFQVSSESTKSIDKPIVDNEVKIEEENSNWYENLME